MCFSLNTKLPQYVRKRISHTVQCVAGGFTAGHALMGMDVCHSRASYNRCGQEKMAGQGKNLFQVPVVQMGQQCPFPCGAGSGGSSAKPVLTSLSSLPSVSAVRPLSTHLTLSTSLRNFTPCQPREHNLSVSAAAQPVVSPAVCHGHIVAPCPVGAEGKWCSGGCGHRAGTLPGNTGHLPTSGRVTAHCLHMAAQGAWGGGGGSCWLPV